MRRFLLGLLTLLAFCGPALAASDKPLVILAGKTQTIPSGDTLNLTLNPLATNISGSTQCVQASSAGLLSGTGSACGTGTGTVTTTGSPASGNLTKFSGSTSITNGDLSGDCTTSATLATVCLKTNGVNFGTFATQNYATPPAIGGTTPAAGAFTTLGATGNLTTNVTGSTQCIQVNSGGVISGTGSTCGSGSGSVTSVTCGTGLSGGVITSTGTCSLTAPVTVALGGTNATSASGTALDNISGFASTGFLTRTGAGTYAFQSATNGVTLGNLAQIAANTVLGNATASTANIAAQAMPSCSAATSALTWTTSSGFGCNTISGGGTGTVTSVATSGGVTGGAITTTGTVSLIGVAPPSGRLTLVTGTPVMNSDQTAKSTVYYDCYNGNRVPYYDGSNDQVDTIASCEVSLTMQTSGTGVTNTTGVFDIWWVHSGANRICVATNGSGGGWASDTAGSNTARGTGYSQVHNARGYWTNVNSISNCYNGSTDYGSVSADRATYIGTIYTTAAGQTGVQFAPTPASGGTNGCLCLFNAYNRISVISMNRDSAASYTKNSSVWGPMNAGATGSGLNERVSMVDGLGVAFVTATRVIWGAGNSSSIATCGGIDEDSSTATPPQIVCAPYSQGSGWTVESYFTPLTGLHYFQAVDATNGNLTYYCGGTVLYVSTATGACTLAVKTEQ